MSTFNEYILNIYINLIHFIVKFNINSTCYMFHGQPIEPDSLKRYKKAKKINQNWSPNKVNLLFMWYIEQFWYNTL